MIKFVIIILHYNSNIIFLLSHLFAIYIAIFILVIINKLLKSLLIFFVIDQYFNLVINLIKS